MKIVTYNVNGLRPRVAQFGSLLKLLNSLDADVICLQETKLRRQDLTADMVMAAGYESFLSCTRTSDRARAGYSGVATFCRLKAAFNSDEVALPVAAEEGFSGLLGDSVATEGMEEFTKEEMLEIDGEGRCVVTDHHHFVLFNLYGPRAGGDDTERIDFKLKFYSMLQKRWETLLAQGRRIIVVGDLNIAPTCLDRCEAGSEFENNQFRRWFRSMLVENGGSFYDVLRAKHPDRREAYTCWSQSSGAEEFNYGSRIDHILCAGLCFHEEQDLENHNFVACHVDECDILTQYKRWKPGNSLRWKEGQRSIKLVGSDHAPVFTSLLEMSSVYQHNTPRLSARYIPMVRGLQQTLVSTLMKRKVSEAIDGHNNSSGETQTSSPDQCGTPCSSSSQDFIALSPRTAESSRNLANEAACKTLVTSCSEPTKQMSGNKTKKKAKGSQLSQLSLKSFFQKSSIPSQRNSANSGIDVPPTQMENLESHNKPNETSIPEDQSGNLKQCELQLSASIPGGDQDELIASSSKKEKNSLALVEWQRLQQVMQNSIPICKGHKEPCVARVVKKQGPTYGCRFYVCARAEGPSSNPEANCNYFKWAALKPRNNMPKER